MLSVPRGPRKLPQKQSGGLTRRRFRCDARKSAVRWREQSAAIGTPAPRLGRVSPGASDPCRNMSAPYFRAAARGALLCLRRYRNPLCSFVRDGALLTCDCVRRQRLLRHVPSYNDPCFRTLMTFYPTLANQGPPRADIGPGGHACAVPPQAVIICATAGIDRQSE